MASKWVQQKFAEAIKSGSNFWVRFYHLLGANVNQAFNFREFHFSRHLAEKRFVLEEGAFTPLMWACMHNAGKGVQHFLISRGANINSYISSNNCRFHDINLRGYSALSITVSFSGGISREELEDTILGMIADGAEIDSSPVPGTSPLALAKRRDLDLSIAMLADYRLINKNIVV